MFNSIDETDFKSKLQDALSNVQQSFINTSTESTSSDSTSAETN